MLGDTLCAVTFCRRYLWVWQRAWCWMAEPQNLGQGCQKAREAVRLGRQTCIARLAPAWRAGETLQTRTCEHACMPALEYQVTTFLACLQAMMKLLRGECKAEHYQ